MRSPTDPVIRVLVCDMPLMLRQVIEVAIDAAPGMEVVASIPRPQALAAVAARSRPHLIVVGLEGSQLPAGCRRSLSPEALTPMIGIEATDGHAYVFRPPGERTPIGEISPAGLVATIRDLVGGAPHRR